jgi:hypothetical protein
MYKGVLIGYENRSAIAIGLNKCCVCRFAKVAQANPVADIYAALFRRQAMLYRLLSNVRLM